MAKKENWKELALLTVILIIAFCVVVKFGMFVYNDIKEDQLHMEENRKICEELGYDTYYDRMDSCTKKVYGLYGFNEYSYTYESSGSIDFEKYKEENWK